MSKRIFILEDDVHVVRIVRATLERDGYELSSWNSTAGALDDCRKFRPDLILLDVMLPDGDGFHFCSQVRGDALLKDVPVIFLTRKGDIESRLKGFAAGGQDYVTKPFDAMELAARVNAHLARKHRLETAEQARQKLLVQNRIRQDLVDMILHDLRSPLGTIKITLGLIRESGLIADADYTRLVRNAETAADFVLFMINDMLDLSIGKLSINPSPLDVNALFARLEALLAPQAERRRLTLRIHATEETTAITTDDLLLFRILINLLSNAVKFSPAGSTIGLSISKVDGGVRFEVVDQGPGIPDAEKEKVFQKFYRADTPTTRSVPGAGIGLAFCRMAATALGGRLWAEDGAGGKGSRFLLELPSKPPAAAKTREVFEELLGPEVMKDYLDSCRKESFDARGWAERLSGPEALGSLRKLKTFFHKLAGSAGTYGFPEASEISARTEKHIDAFLASGGNDPSSLKETLEAAVDSTASALGLSDRP